MIFYYITKYKQKNHEILLFVFSSINFNTAQ